jgi:hypothetical protein
MTPAELIREWQHLKEVEAQTIERRRIVEDEIVALFRINTALETTNTLEIGDTVVRVSPRLDRKVDAAKLQDLAAEHGLDAHLSTLFRWKPEINVALWKQADERITAALAPAITVKPGRPSFSIKE